MARYFIAYPSDWENEIITHFGSISRCAKMCHVNRCNIYKSFGGDGYISEKMLMAICRKMDLAPICFTETKMHNTFYNDAHKWTFSEYERVKEFHAIQQASGDPDADWFVILLKTWGGLSNFEIASIPEDVKTDLYFKIVYLIDDTLSKNLPGWIGLRP